jgi:hypothetical protein
VSNHGVHSCLANANSLTGILWTSSKRECKSKTLEMCRLGCSYLCRQIQTGKGVGEDSYNGMVDCFRKIIRNEGYPSPLSPIPVLPSNLPIQLLSTLSRHHGTDSNGGTEAVRTLYPSLLLTMLNSYPSAQPSLPPMTNGAKSTATSSVSAK